MVVPAAVVATQAIQLVDREQAGKEITVVMDWLPPALRAAAVALVESALREPQLEAMEGLA
jgi:hypothetical protein